MRRHKLSLLAAERQTTQTTLNEQATQWEAALHQVTEMAEEAVEQERTKTVEVEVDVNVFRLELQESQQELQTWTDWYGDLPEAETSEQQQEDFHSIAGEQPASLPAISEIPGASPLTPPVVQHPTLQSRHLPPANLRFSDISARAAAESQRAEEISQEQEEARRVLQQAELSTSQTQPERERECELQHARRTIQLLEQNQVGSGAPSFTPTLTPPPQGYPSHLTPSHPTPATPATLRGPWAATRERLQRTSAPAQVLPSNCLGVPSSSGLPYLSGACSVPGFACPVFASPIPAPATPYQGLPHLQMPLQPPLQPPTTVHQDEGKIDFKREKSALPKLQIKGGAATSITRTIHECLQRTSLTLNTWSASAVQLWLLLQVLHNAVAVAKAAHQQWTSMTPSQRALQTGLLVYHQLAMLYRLSCLSLKQSCDRISAIIAYQKRSSR